MYWYKGITTNNLKNISVEFNDHELIYIGGVSGSGKSSLAFDTIAAISENEYGSLINDNKVSIKYCIEDYGDVLVPATLKQLNFNLNPRSTILTYFGLYPHIANILSKYTAMPADSFSPNGPCRCKKCNGIGYIDKIDELLVVDSDKTLKEGPFKPWNASYSDYYSQLLHNFCLDNGIDENKKFYELNKEIQYKLLYSKGSKKYKITFFVNKRKRIKTSVYIGPILGFELEKNDMYGLNRDKYLKQKICPECKGSRLSNSINTVKIVDTLFISDFFIKSMDDVESFLNKIKSLGPKHDIKASIDFVQNFIHICKRLNVSYLNFSRSIKTLSGGELQRLRMVHLLLGKLKNLLIVLDEPTGSLDKKEVDSIINIISELKRNNTVVVVDHNAKLKDIADRTYYLGPKSGINGGQLISADEYTKAQIVPDVKIQIKENSKISILLESDYVDYTNEFIFYDESLNGLCGESGIGKSTILKDILPYKLDGYRYITQKPIKANSTSTIATYTDIIDEVRTYYSKITKKEKKIFSLSQDGACLKCGGKGSILIGDFYEEKLYIDCDLCNGTGYSKLPLDCKINGFNIFDFLNQTIDQIIESNISISKKFDDTIHLLSRLGLGHLSLNQKVSSLSGGENQRIKLSQSLRENKIKILGLDEPSKGLGRKEIFNLISVIYANIENYGKTFIVIEHNPYFLNMCQHVSELLKKDGKVVVQQKF